MRLAISESSDNRDVCPCRIERNNDRQVVTVQIGAAHPVSPISGAFIPFWIAHSASSQNVFDVSRAEVPLASALTGVLGEADRAQSTLL